jgi:hypothetical protein
MHSSARHPLVLAAFCAALAGAADAKITSARYVEPTTAYGHGAVEGGEYAGLQVTFSSGHVSVLRLDDAVFEDTEPRLFDFNGDGEKEIVTVSSSFDQGAQVIIFQEHDSLNRIEKVASNDPIGRRNRWLAIAGIADFDNDGHIDIAYIDRPHLAKELVLLSVGMSDAHGAILNETRHTGIALTNHAYGAPEIEGGIRECANEKPVIVTANGDWSQVMETSWSQAQQTLVSTAVATYHNKTSFTPFLVCQN